MFWAFAHVKLEHSDQFQPDALLSVTQLSLSRNEIWVHNWSTDTE